MRKPTLQITGLLTLLFVSFVPAKAQPITIRTMAGNNDPGSIDGNGSRARFNHPLGITADNSGNVYVADTENGTIRKIDSAGLVTTLAGEAGNFGSSDGFATSAHFFGPQGIAADTVGNVYVSDSANGTVRKISVGQMVTTLAGSVLNFNSLDGLGTNAYFYRPAGIAVDTVGNVYIADAWNHNIRKITPAGLTSSLAGLAGNPGSVDSTNSKARFNQPRGIAIDTATNLFVADSLNHTIRKISPDGNVTAIAGMPGVWGNTDGTNRNARFFHPQGIAVVGTNTLFVSDSGNELIRKLSLSGTNWIVSTVAGSRGTPGKQNGTGSIARFSSPHDLASDNLGNLYVADMGNHLIRSTRIVPPTLQILRAGPLVTIFWPQSADDFVLESSSTIDPEGVWTAIANGISNQGDDFAVTNATIQTASYYRLRWQ